MVRINLLKPSCLADQHLVAEYNEILMLLGYVRKYPDQLDIPKEYCLGKGHIKFFKNKLLYLESRFNVLKKEMKKRGFVPKKDINLRKFDQDLCKNWRPKDKDISLIKKRLRKKLRMKPHYYRYHGENRSLRFFLSLLNT